MRPPGDRGQVRKHRLESGLEEGFGENLKPGMAAVVTIVHVDDRLAAEQALGGSPAKSVAAIDGNGLGWFKDALGVAAGKFNPDRHEDRDAPGHERPADHRKRGCHRAGDERDHDQRSDPTIEGVAGAPPESHETLVVQAGLEEQSAEPAERDITPANAS